MRSMLEAAQNGKSKVQKKIQQSRQKKRTRHRYSDTKDFFLISYCYMKIDSILDVISSISKLIG